MATLAKPFPFQLHTLALTLPLTHTCSLSSPPKLPWTLPLAGAEAAVVVAMAMVMAVAKGARRLGWGKVSRHQPSRAAPHPPVHV